MLTQGDDYPVHQTPEPIAYSGNNRNFYDRYFFNGYGPDGEVYFAAALGIYPHLNIMDGAFSVIVDGIQHNVRASKELRSERLDLQVGALSVEVIKPLQTLKYSVNDPHNGITAELTFEGRVLAQEEPRFTRRVGAQTVFDYTRLTQHGDWRGWIEVKGKRIEVTPEQFQGTRDRSWGIRPVGMPDPQVNPSSPASQFYWIWAPLNFDFGGTLFHRNETETGEAWNADAVKVPLASSGLDSQHWAYQSHQITMSSGTRHPQSVDILLKDKQQQDVIIKLKTRYNYYMNGMGYTHPEWGHGHYKGELATGYDEFALASVDPTLFHNLHVQSYVDATLTTAEGSFNGRGIFEQLIIGPHQPSGFTQILDMAP